MLAGTTDDAPHPLDQFVPDPGEYGPACDEPEFAALLAEMVADSAPRVFAVVQEWGDRVDAHIAAWGLSFDDGTLAFGVDGRLHLVLRSPESALRMFRVGTRIRTRLVWVDPDQAD